MDWFTVGADSSSRRVVAVSEERTSDGMETIYTVEQRSSEHGAIMVSEVAEDTMKEEHGEMLEAYKQHDLARRKEARGGERECDNHPCWLRNRILFQSLTHSYHAQRQSGWRSSRRGLGDAR